MLTETTVTKLREMRLSVMANALKDQMEDPQYKSMAFEDRLGLLVDAEWNARKSNRLRKLIRQAAFSDSGACLENVEYLPDRKLKQEEMLRFGSCNYIHEHHNIILLGATGSGKTYLACALGMAAARQFLPVKYVRLPDLLVDFSIARGNGTIRKLMAQYKKYALLIIDEWLLYPLSSSISPAGVTNWLTRSWRMPSATASCTIPIPSLSPVRNPCANGKASTNKGAFGSPGSARTRDLSL